jgi:membrane protease YdiL (CAAX protease family)
MPYRWWDGSHWTSYAADTEVQWDEVVETNDEPRPPGPRSLGIALIGYVGGVGLAFVIAAALRAADRPGGRVVELCASQAGLWSGLIGACLYVSKRRGTGSLSRDFGWHMERIDVGLGFAGSFVGRVIAAILISPIASSFRHVRAPDRTVFEKVANDAVGWTVLVLIVCIGAPLVEELFFRGLLQTRLVEVAGTTGGIVITAVLFGAAHLIAWQGTITLLYGLGIAGAGLVLGLMRHISGRLGPSTWAHAFFNIQAVLAVAFLT